MVEISAFLGIKKSASGKFWQTRDVSDRDVMTMSQRHSLPDQLARVMVGRGVTIDNADDYLNPTIKNLMPDPSHLLDMDKAVAHIIYAIKNNQKIAVFGDYDVDGATSSALLYRFFKMINLDITIYIPDRIIEGYGPNIAALKKIRDQGIKTIITVDCGTTAFDVLAEAKAYDIDIIVIDHHVAEAKLPDVIALVNPNRLDEDSKYGNLAAVGVVFLLIVALSRSLKLSGFYKDIKPPDLLSLLDIVALGTICDVVPLTNLNRALVSQGLKVMSKQKNIGINALSDVAKINEMSTAYHLGFQLGPRINAGGRVGEAALGSRILSTDDNMEAQEIAIHLDQLNHERKEIEAICLEQAIIQVENNPMNDGLVYATANDWHAGVIGIVASRLKERYNRPACVVTFENGIGKGSGRSIDGVDLGAAVISANQAGLLEAGGGHKMAAGFSVAQEKNDDFRQYLADHIAKQLSNNDITKIIPRIYIDGAIDIKAANFDFVKQLESLAPFGSGNATPKFVFCHLKVTYAAIVGSDHVQCRFSSENGNGTLKAIAFRSVGQPLGDLLLNARGDMPIHVVGRLQLDAWRGNDNVQLIIDDAAVII